MVQRWQRGYPVSGRSWLKVMQPLAALMRLARWRPRRVEQVELLARRYAYQPLRFRWHGLPHHVQRIECVWEQGPQAAPRRYFQVRCGDARLYTLFQDLRLGAWYVEVA